MPESRAVNGEGRFAVAPPRGGMSQVSGVDQHSYMSGSIGDTLMSRSADSAELPALMWTGESVAQQLTWAQLADRGLRGAATLLELNPDRHRVALAGVNSVDWIVAVFACALGGMPVVPIRHVSGRVRNHW